MLERAAEIIQQLILTYDDNTTENDSADFGMQKHPRIGGEYFRLLISASGAVETPLQKRGIVVLIHHMEEFDPG